MPIEQTADRELQNRIDGALQSSSHGFGQQIRTRHDDGVVVLHGRVETYYQKQLAQEALRKLDGVERVINLLEVHWDIPMMAARMDRDEEVHEGELLAIG